MIRRFCALFQYVPKLRQTFAAMVEYRVQNDTYPLFMRGLYKFLKIFVGAEMPVYAVIIADIVFVV